MKSQDRAVHKLVLHIHCVCAKFAVVRTVCAFSTAWSDFIWNAATRSEAREPYALLQKIETTLAISYGKFQIEMLHFQRSARLCKLPQRVSISFETSIRPRNGKVDSLAMLPTDSIYIEYNVNVEATQLADSICVTDMSVTGRR